MHTQISKTAIIYPGVELGPDVVIEDYCIIGIPPIGRLGKVTKIGANSVIRSHTVIYSGNIIGVRFQTGNKANIREDNTIGEDVSIGTLSVVEHNVWIENGVRIHSQAFIPEFTTLREGCWIGPNVILTNAKFPMSPKSKKNLIGPTVGKKAKLGAKCTVLPGIQIGNGALVGAGSVVTKDVAENAVVVGNPARVIKSLKDLPY